MSQLVRILLFRFVQENASAKANNQALTKNTQNERIGD
jgi:hypothetical protein